MDEARARLRNTFKYPSDSENSSNASRDEMDEEEQESLLANLTTTTTKHDTLYRTIFTTLPLASTLPFLTHLLLHPNRTTALPALLSITSLGISAFSMYTVQTDSSPGRPGKRPSAIFSQPSSLPGTGSASRASSEGPLLRYLPYLNISLAVLLLFLSFLFSTKDSVSEGFWLLLLLPAVMLGVVTVVKGSMADIDRGLGELKGLRYEYKGA